jgi:hypothetical protein
MSRSLGSAVVLVLLAGCAETNAPLPDPVEVFLAVNRDGSSLNIVPVEDPESGDEVPLGVAHAQPTSLAARNGIALVPLGTGDGVAVVDLRRSRWAAIPRASCSRAAGSSC